MEILLWIAAIWVALNLAGAAVYLLATAAVLSYQFLTAPRATYRRLKEKHDAS